MRGQVEQRSPLARLRQRSRDTPQRPAMVAGDRTWTCAQLDGGSARVAAGLRARGVRPGDRVALHLHNSADAVVALLACLRAGAVAVPLNTQLTTPELRDLTERTSPVLYLGERALYDRFAPVPPDLLPPHARLLAGDPHGPGWPEPPGDPAGPEPDLDPDAPALLLSTSGSTGASKLVIWSHRTLGALHLSGPGRGIAPGDVLPILTPVMHGSGVYHLLTALAQGALPVLVQHVEPGAVLDAVARHGITSVFGMPFLCAELAREQLRQPRRVGTLRAGLVSGDTCPPEVFALFTEAFGVPLRAFWAATEDVGASVAAPESGPYVRMLPAADVRIVTADGRPAAPGEPGELLVSSPTTTPGYWTGPGDPTPLPEGVFRTGDLVRTAAEPGVLEYLGRAKDLIVRAGSNISPHEIEQVLRGHPGVLDAGAAGLPDPELGQRVGVLVVLAPGPSGPPIGELADWLGERLAGWKLPDRIRAVPAIPRNALTKVDRIAVRRELTAG
jgi:long-chain acyl-CoA synthetase